MEMIIREGNLDDLVSIQQLGQKTWNQFKENLTSENWATMLHNISDKNLYKTLLLTSKSFVCENNNGKIVGFSFFVASGNPTEIYSNDQCYIRFLTVSDEYKGMRTGQKLTEKCIDLARKNGERKIALHTSEFMEKARHIYEKIGFKIVKEIEPRYGKKYWLYEMKL